MTYEERKEKLGSFSGIEKTFEPPKRQVPTSSDPNMVWIDIEDDKYKEFYEKCEKFNYSEVQEILKSLVDAYIADYVMVEIREEIDSLNCSKIPCFLTSQSRSILRNKCESRMLNMHNLLSSLVQNFIEGTILIQERYPFASHSSASPQSPVKSVSKPFLVAMNGS